MKYKDVPKAIRRLDKFVRGVYKPSGVYAFVYEQNMRTHHLQSLFARAWQVIDDPVWDIAGEIYADRKARLAVRNAFGFEV
jgi:hypothetical protein